MERPNFNCIAYDLGDDLQDLIAYKSDLEKYTNKLEVELRKLRAKNPAIKFPSPKEIDLEVGILACKNKKVDNYNLKEKRAFKQGVYFVKMLLDLQN